MKLLFVAAALALAIAPAQARKARVCAVHGFEGLASYYHHGDGHSGLVTANGEAFDDEAMTIAHRCLPFGTMLRLCRGDLCVTARVNDRGPYVPGRVVDLSRGVARKLGMLDAGVALVTAEEIGE